MHALRSLMVIALATFLLAGCGASKVEHFYDGDPRPASETASITAGKDHSTLVALNGEQLEKVRTIVLVPGRYNVTVGSNASKLGARTLTIDVEAGHTYLTRIDYMIGADEVEFMIFRIVDAADGSVVVEKYSNE